MTKSEYMKKLSYSLRRLPKEDFNQAIDYFEEYFAEAGEENEQQAIEDLGSPEDAAKELIMNLAEKNMEQPPKTVKHSFKAVWIGILGICIFRFLRIIPLYRFFLRIFRSDHCIRIIKSINNPHICLFWL